MLLLFGAPLRAQYLWKHTLPADVQCIAMASHANGRILYTASYDSSGIFRSEDGGFTWEPIKDGFPDQAPANIKQIFCPPSDTNIVLALSFTYGIFRSTDGGRHWSLPFEHGGANGEAMGFHARTTTLYYGQALAGPTWRSTDLGANWERIGEPNDSITLCSIGVSPYSDIPVILAGAINGAIGRTADLAQTWHHVIPPEVDSLTGFPPEVPKITYSDHIPGHAFVTRWLSRDSSLMTTFDDGLTWQNIIAPNPRTWAIEPDQRYVFSQGGKMRRMWIGMFNILEDTVVKGVVQETIDFGATWRSTSFPYVRQVWMIKFDTVSGKLAVATDEGVFITTVPLAVKEESVDKLTIYGNPLVSTCRIEIPESAESGELRIIDALGRITLGRMLQGEAFIEISTDDLPPGSYTVQVIGVRKTHVARLIAM